MRRWTRRWPSCRRSATPSPISSDGGLGKRGTGAARVVALAACLALAGCDSGPSLPRLAPDAVILAFGDSLTYGTGAGEAESYPAVLATLVSREVVNAGVPGEVTERGLRRLPRVLEDTRPALVILIHGGNDILQRRGRDRAEHNLREMVRTIRASGAAVVMLGVPDFGIPGLLSSADFYARVAGEMDVPIDDEIIPDLVGDNRYKSDRVHPNAAGYARLAAAIRDLLVDRGAL